MQLYQSFWTKPADKQFSLRENIIFSALSCCYAKAAGYSLNLHTDYKGNELLKYLPYDNILIDLDNIDVSYQLQSAAKVLAYQNEPLGSIHIDNDIYLYKYKDLSYDNFDIITQWGHRDTISDNHMHYLKYVFKEVINDDWYNYNYTFHCGFVGFNNKQLLQEFTDDYFKTAYNYSKSNIINTYSPHMGNIEWALEESLLAYDSRNYKSTEVLPYFISRTDWVFHDHGINKFINTDQVLFELKYKFNDIYTKTVDLINNLTPECVSKPRFVHSFWSKPALLHPENFKQLIRLYAVSASYVKSHGCQIVLHTDDFGKKLLKDIPYDEIHLTLNSIPDYIHPSFFAYGKFIAMEHEPLHSFHIDGDVFLKKPELIDYISNYDCDILVQDSWSDMIKEEYIMYNQELLKKYILSYNYYGSFKSSNTGILCWHNSQLKTNCINNYKDIVDKCCKDNDIIKELNKYERLLVPDLVIEQQLIYKLSQNYKLGELCKWINPELLGYEHILTPIKYNDENIFKCISDLQKLNPDLNKLISNYADL